MRFSVAGMKYRLTAAVSHFHKTWQLIEILERKDYMNEM